MKILNSKQIREIDLYTISHEPVLPVDLMERAAGKLFSWISARYDKDVPFIIFAGPGNNGGDGLALARMLSGAGYKCHTYYLNLSGKQSESFRVNSDRLLKVTGKEAGPINTADPLPPIQPGAIIIDAIFGSGLTRPPDGLAAEIIRAINATGNTVISIDMPSGLMDEENNYDKSNSIIQAHSTLCFEFPRLSFMFSENQKFTGEWHILKIGLHPNAIENAVTRYFYLSREMIAGMLKKRGRFSHKGDFGHGLLAGGSLGKIGAVALGARAALRSGIGLLTCHVPACGYSIIQSSVHEAMCQADDSQYNISEVKVPPRCNAIAAGPGMGTSEESGRALAGIISNTRLPLILDADAINILAADRELLNKLPPGTILTPHPGEFERLAGASENSFERLRKQAALSERTGAVIILKGAHTSISFPDGTIHFNSTGNPGMATGGSGDVLTGIILSFLAQGYSPREASLAGVFIHGMAGDIAASKGSLESLIASDITDSLGFAFNEIRNN